MGERECSLLEQWKHKEGDLEGSRHDRDGQALPITKQGGQMYCSDLSRGAPKSQANNSWEEHRVNAASKQGRAARAYEKARSDTSPGPKAIQEHAD
jgi:hypothetical protein